jgi:energy-coupling factor transport system substrate-specific component
MSHLAAYPSRSREQMLALIITGTVFNLALGALIRLVQAPVYLDAIGTIVVTLIAGPLVGAAAGVASFGLGSLFVSPVLIFFSGTQIVIALYSHFVGRRGWLRTWYGVLLSGIGLGVVAGAVSAPVIVYLFGGITGSGASLIAAYLLATGQKLLNAVLLSGLAAEPIDKTLQMLLAVWVLRAMPQRVLSTFANPSLEKNGFLGGQGPSTTP